MLAIAHALIEAKAELPAPLIFLGNVGEEGEGTCAACGISIDRARWPAVRRAYRFGRRRRGLGGYPGLGSRRFQVTVSGPGAISFTDAGTPNPIVALAFALAALAETALPEEPRTTLNLARFAAGPA